jgi:hypothetical protein
MARRWRFVLITVASLVAMFQPALAKGPIEATIEGPGLDAPIRLEGHEAASALSYETGFMKDEAWGYWPPPLEAEAPTAALGPRYLVKWLSLPGGVVVIEELYPHAEGGPLTYVPPGQSLGFTQGYFEIFPETRGGWYRAPEALREVLFDLGVPEQLSPPRPFWLPALALVAVVGAGASFLLHRARNGRIWAQLPKGANASTHQSG